MTDPSQLSPQEPAEIVQDKKSENKIQKIVHREIQAMGFSGPIPPPQMLHQYDKVLPGAAERIVSMAEKQSNHRQSMERTLVLSDTNNARLGLIFSFILVVSTIGAGTFLICIGKEAQGLTAIIGAIGSVVAVFIYQIIHLH